MESGVIELILALVGGILASSGFWALIQRRVDRNDNSKALLLGLAHDRIMFLETQYLKKGFITTDEYENLVTYLYEPYIDCGGDGTVEHMMTHVKALEVKHTHKEV